MSSNEEIKLESYIVFSGKSTCSTHVFTSLQTIADELVNGFVVLWQHHGVFVGKIENKEIKWFDENENSKKVYEEHKQENIVRIRAFDENREYHIWRNSEGLKGRLREDNSGEETKQYIETSMILRGVIAKPLQSIFNNSKLCIKTRNYIGYNSIGQAGYVDSRFVKFI